MRTYVSPGTRVTSMSVGRSKKGVNRCGAAALANTGKTEMIRGNTRGCIRLIFTAVLEPPTMSLSQDVYRTV